MVSGVDQNKGGTVHRDKFVSKASVTKIEIQAAINGFLKQREQLAAWRIRWLMKNGWLT
jgi:hypothetical protein